jgi:voltage-gated potassium channel
MNKNSRNLKGNSIKLVIYRFLEKGSHGSRIYLIFDYFIMTLILLNVVALVLETFPEIKYTVGDYFTIFEIFSIVIFTIEYLLRIYIADLTYPSSSKIKSKLKFVFSFFGLIDLFAILPFYLPLLISVDLRILRIFQLMRFLRIFKIARYNRSLDLIYSVIKEKKSELAMTGFAVLLTLIVASFLVFKVEGDVQPEKFPNLLSCFLWAFATFTSIGYGDVYPITTLGKFLTVIISALGIGLIALPTGIISAGFFEKIEKDKKKSQKCPHCGKEIS